MVHLTHKSGWQSIMVGNSQRWELWKTDHSTSTVSIGAHTSGRGQKRSACALLYIQLGSFTQKMVLPTIKMGLPHQLTWVNTSYSQRLTLSQTVSICVHRGRSPLCRANNDITTGKREYMMVIIFTSTVFQHSWVFTHIVVNPLQSSMHGRAKAASRLPGEKVELLIN